MEKIYISCDMEGVSGVSSDGIWFYRSALECRLPWRHLSAGDASLRFIHADFITTFRAFSAIQTLSSGSYLK
ncbi:MAG TPA: hypothetical protein DHW42_00805 [Candidatus Marinimicrobia bacterium]|nr:hypothetical protein [Candidatus Neomarinimicrobiota bacterium]